MGISSGFWGKASQEEKTYQYIFPHVCVCCGQPPEKYIDFRVDEQLGWLFRRADVKVPYCTDHLEEIKRFKVIKFVCQFLFADLIFITALVMVSNYFDDTGSWFSAIIGLLICVPILQLFNFLLLDKVLRIFDREHLFESKTNTLGFTADITMGVILFHFSNLHVAQMFMQANRGNKEIMEVADPKNILSLLQ